MPYIVNEVFVLLGFLLRVLGFLLVGFGIGRFILDSYKQAVWQVQIALVLSFFGVLIALTEFASAGAAGAFALGAGISFFMAGKSTDDEKFENGVRKKSK